MERKETNANIVKKKMTEKKDKQEKNKKAFVRAAGAVTVMTPKGGTKKPAKPGAGPAKSPGAAKMGKMTKALRL